MDSEFQILKCIENNKYVTQRSISEHTGISLGNVNILLKRLITKGLLTIERVNAKAVKYILTPSGIKEKSELTYKYIVKSFRLIIELQSKIKDIINEEAKLGISRLVLFGQKDELYDIISSKLRQENINFAYIENLDGIYGDHNHSLSEDNGVKTLVIVWNISYEKMLADKKIKYLNLLNVV